MFGAVSYFAKKTVLEIQNNCACTVLKHQRISSFVCLCTVREFMSK